MPLSDSSKTCMWAVRLIAFTRRPVAMPRFRHLRGLPVLVHGVSRRAWGLRLRRAGQQLAISLLTVLPSASGDGVGALIANFRSSIPSPSVPLFTLRLVTSQRPVQNSGPGGSLLLSRKALSSSTPCRFIPAHHHIFFPPRLQIMCLQQDADCLSSYLQDQFPLDRLFGNQAHAPSRLPRRRWAAHHGDHPLALARV